MANTIITKNSSTASAVPTSGQLVQGELAVNVTDKRLFTENNGGVVVEVGVNPSSITTGNLTASGTVTIPDNAISGDKVEGGTINAVTINTLTSGTVDINGGAVDSSTIGATTPSTGAFTSLSASGTSTLAAVNATALTVTSPSGSLNAVFDAPAGSNTIIGLSNGAVNKARVAIAGGTNSLVLGSLAGDLVIRAAQRTLFTEDDGVTLHAALSSTGLAVTGAISATEIISANKGITFPATQVASADANTLDDYEEGTWTPDVRGSTAAGTGTYTLQRGTYTKTGRSVTVVFRLTWTNLTSATGNLMLGGLPFTINNAVVNFAFTPVGNLNLTYAAGSVVAVGWGATGSYSYVAFDIAAMAANTGFTAVAIDTAAELLGSVTYFV